MTFVSDEDAEREWRRRGCPSLEQQIREAGKDLETLPLPPMQVGDRGWLHPYSPVARRIRDQFLAGNIRSAEGLEWCGADYAGVFGFCPDCNAHRVYPHRGEQYPTWLSREHYELGFLVDCDPGDEDDGRG